MSTQESSWHGAQVEIIDSVLDSGYGCVDRPTNKVDAGVFLGSVGQLG